MFHTDSSHHTVGDSRSAGIFQPYDGKCYTNEEGIYTKELEMDYPSVTMINRLAIEKKVIIIFTLRTHEPENLYDSLIGAIQGSKMAVLSDSDIVTHLRESYKVSRDEGNPSYSLSFFNVPISFYIRDNKTTVILTKMGIKIIMNKEVKV